MAAMLPESIEGLDAASLLPDHAFMGRFEFSRTPKDVDGNVVEGSDFCILTDKGRFALYYTHGPAPGGPQNGARAEIRMRTSSSADGPWSRWTRAISPAPNHPLGIFEGFDTFDACQLPDGSWYALTEGRRMPKHTANPGHCIVSHRAPEFTGPWTSEKVVMGRSLQWTLPAMAIEDDKPKEYGGLFECSPRVLGGKKLVSPFAALSPYPDGRAQRVGLALSMDLGDSWFMFPEPILVPPAREHDRNGINAITHPNLTMDPRGGAHLFCAAGGKVPFGSEGGRGLNHYFSMDLVTWHPNPLNPVLPNGPKGSARYTHVGSPTAHLLETRGGYKWIVGTHAENMHDTKTPRNEWVKRHFEMATEA